LIPGFDGALFTVSLNLVFRSTDAIVYYLGELVRAKFGGHGPKQDSDGDPLFDLGRNGLVSPMW